IHDQTNAVAIDLLQELHRRFKDKVIPVVVRRDSKLREAASFGQSIIDYAPESTGAEDYSRLAHWVLENLRARSPEVASVVAEHELLPHEEPAPAAQADDEADGDESAEQSAIPSEAAAIPAAPSPDVKPISRAEDVARRAQEFLRRVALGR